jgi:hypothetical protein
MIGKDKIVFDPAAAADTDNIGAYVRAGTDGDKISSTLEGGKEGLDVYVINPSLEVTQGTDPWVIGDGGGSITVDAVDLDIRDLTQADEVTVFQGTSPWVVSGTVAITDDANHAEDSAHTSGDIGKFMLAVRNDANTSLVSADGDYAPLQVDSVGRLKVSAEVTVEAGDAEYLEDSAHASGDAGLHMLLVRQDTLATSTSASGDYGSFKSDDLGALWVHVSETAPAPADDQFANAAVAVGTSAIAVTASLATRRRIIVQNADNSKSIWLGNASVTAANGIRLSAGSALEIELAASAVLYAIANTASADVRVFETGQA